MSKNKNMSKNKKPSGTANFIYIVVAVSAFIAAVCLVPYYTGLFVSAVTLWIGITAFTVMYHLGMRLLFGLVTPLLGISCTDPWFRERSFEKKLYSILRVKRWKSKALTFNPELYNVRERSLSQIADTTAKSETDHWINVFIALSTIAFGALWGQWWIFSLTAVLAALFDTQFIIIQRYNRPRLMKLLKRRGEAKAKL